MRASDPRLQTVLLIDDDAISRELLGLLLEGEGFAVLACASGQEALDLLKSVDEAPEIILTDLHMPGISGVELAAALSPTRAKGAFLLAMSATQPTEKVAARFDGFLLKPFTGSDFSAAVKRFSERAGAGSTAPAAVKDEPGAARGQSGRGGAAVLNEGTYAKLAAAMPGAQLKELYAFCLADARERIGRMRVSAAGDDAAGFAKEAHAIKGSCSMLGAGEMAEIAAEMERLGASPWDRVVAMGRIEKFIEACGRLERMV